jgi:hypothetical protein
MPLRMGGKNSFKTYCSAPQWVSVGAATERWILQRMHHKTVFVKINKCCVLYNDLASRLLCMIKNESDKKSDVLDIFSKKLIGFLMKGKLVSIHFEIQQLQNPPLNGVELKNKIIMLAVQFCLGQVITILEHQML